MSLLLLSKMLYSFGQGPVVKKPQPSTLSPSVIIGNPNGRNNPTPNVPTFPNFNNSNQQQWNMHEQDRLDVQHRNEIQQMLNEDYEYFSSNQSIRYDLPSWAGVQGAEYFYQTAEKLLDMLSGKPPLNLKEAIFLVENAYFEGQLDHAKYDKAIQNLASIAQQKAKEDGYNWKNPMTKNVMLFRVMSDTLKIKLPLQESSTISYPMQYDFEDYEGKIDWSKMFVTKLLATHKGQCHSLPLLYLILCEAVGAEANLAFSPKHSYVKFKDQTGNWYNLELTQGKIVTDAFIVGSGFITSETIKSGIYMKPQEKKQIIAHCLSDLTMGYIRKYGYDPFVRQCIDSVLQYAPEKISALLVKSNYQTYCFEYVLNQIGRLHPDTLKVHYPQAYKLMNERNNLYRKIDEMGLLEMPKDAYEHWLNSVNEEKERREHDAKYNRVLQLAR
jgi:hypothetical protein